MAAAGNAAHAPSVAAAPEDVDVRALAVPDAAPPPEPEATVVVSVAMPPVALPAAPVMLLMLPIAPIGSTMPTHVTPGASSDVIIDVELDVVPEAVTVAADVTVADTVTVAGVGAVVDAGSADVNVVATFSTSVELPSSACRFSFAPSPAVTIVARALPAAASRLAASVLRLASTLVRSSGTAGGGLASGLWAGEMGKGRTSVPVPAAWLVSLPPLPEAEVTVAAEAKAEGGRTRIAVPAEALGVGSGGR